MNKTFTRYVSAVGVACAVTLLLLVYFGTFRQTDTAQILKELSDAFLAPAAVYLGIAALCAISRTGAFDLLRYSIRNFFRLFRKNMEDKQMPKDFYEYFRWQREKKFTAWHLLFTGIGFLVIAVAFTIAYILL